MELIPSRAATTRTCTRLMEKLPKRVLSIRKEGVPTLSCQRVVGVVAIVEPLA
jgi:hypothetical protein